MESVSAARSIKSVACDGVTESRAVNRAALCLCGKEVVYKVHTVAAGDVLAILCSHLGVKSQLRVLRKLCVGVNADKVGRGVARRRSAIVAASSSFT